MINSKYFISEFKSKFSIDHRKHESHKILTKYPDRIPIIVEKTANCRTLPKIKKYKYLVPADMTIQQMMYIIRKYLELSSVTAIYIFCNNMIPSSSETVGSIYENNKDEDGFLYIFYNGEDTFGCSCL